MLPNKIYYYIDPCKILVFPSERKTSILPRKNTNVYFSVWWHSTYASQSKLSMHVWQWKTSSLFKILLLEQTKG